LGSGDAQMICENIGDHRDVCFPRYRTKNMRARHEMFAVCEQ
jgi:hypothetical protein